jgi:hypothetical protein
LSILGLRIDVLVDTADALRGRGVRNPQRFSARFSSIVRRTGVDPLLLNRRETRAAVGARALSQGRKDRT